MGRGGFYFVCVNWGVWKGSEEIPNVFPWFGPCVVYEEAVEEIWGRS